MNSISVINVSEFIIQRIKTNSKLLAVIVFPFLLFTQSFAQGLEQRMDGDPLDNLPDNVEVLTLFGERADFSPDNKRIAFMSKSFGDAMVIDLETRSIDCLTCSIPAAAFLRVMHLSTGDYILIGPEQFKNRRVSRGRDNELWFLSKEPGSEPVKLNQKLSEGVAVSKNQLKISFSQTSTQIQDLSEDKSRLIVADVDISGNQPRLINKKTVYESPDDNCTIEAQDFYENDTKMTFSCYEPNSLSSVMGIDLETGEVINFSKKPGSYNEAEGIFPDGEFTTVESDNQCDWLEGRRGPWNIDIWKLKLDGTGENWERLTNFNDYEGHKASNPVISTDGRVMAFQTTSTTAPAGVGFGLLLYRFK